MITLTRAAYQLQFRTSEYTGKSTDTKPTSNTPGYELHNGDTFYCIDDQTTFMYDTEGDEWIQQ